MTVFPAGYTILRAEDTARRRPVLIDAWYPASPSAIETPHDYGLGQGHVAEHAVIRKGSHPVVLLSHGAFGSARNYSWIAEHLARNGYLVAGVSHFRESPLYGMNTINPVSALQPWLRPQDCSFALDYLTATSELRHAIDPSRIGALGHSSGGATAIALGGAVFDPGAMQEYCASEEARPDRGCAYARSSSPSPSPGDEASRSYRDDRIRAIVALDPALGPGYTTASLTSMSVPVHIVGSVQNDFLPFEFHAGRYARLIPGASLTRLARGEGHFIFLDECRSDLEANGVPLCHDRSGVHRGRVHEDLREVVTGFFDRHL